MNCLEKQQMVPGVYTTGGTEGYYALDSEQVSGVLLAGCGAIFFRCYFNVSITSLLLNENIILCTNDAQETDYDITYFCNTNIN